MNVKTSKKSAILAVTATLVVAGLSIPAKANDRETIESINQPNACTYIMGKKYCW